jgi:predicted transcriptional regulator
VDKQTITFRVDPNKVRALDRLAESLDRDRSYLLNEAVEQYLSLNEYHLQQIEEGLKQARAGKLLDYDKVRADWKKRLSK